MDSRSTSKDGAQGKIYINPYKILTSATRSLFVLFVFVLGTVIAGAIVSGPTHVLAFFALVSVKETVGWLSYWLGGGLVVYTLPLLILSIELLSRKIRGWVGGSKKIRHIGTTIAITAAGIIGFLGGGYTESFRGPISGVLVAGVFWACCRIARTISNHPSPKVMPKGHES